VIELRLHRGDSTGQRVDRLQPLFQFVDFLLKLTAPPQLDRVLAPEIGDVGLIGFHLRAEAVQRGPTARSDRGPASSSRSHEVHEF
jgi:hypothetical protein